MKPERYLLTAVMVTLVASACATRVADSARPAPSTPGYRAIVQSVDADNVWLRANGELRRIRVGGRTPLVEGDVIVARGRRAVHAALQRGDVLVVHAWRAPASGDPEGIRVHEEAAEMLERVKGK